MRASEEAGGKFHVAELAIRSQLPQLQVTWFRVQANSIRLFSWSYALSRSRLVR